MEFKKEEKEIITAMFSLEQLKLINMILIDRFYLEQNERRCLQIKEVIIKIEHIIFEQIRREI